MRPSDCSRPPDKSDALQAELTELLVELVHVKAAEAAAINNAGLDAQLEYLNGVCFGERELELIAAYRHRPSGDNPGACP